MNDCERARESMVWLADGDAADAWLEAHLKSCESCCKTLVEFLQIDCEMLACGKAFENENSTPVFDRERLAARMESLPPARTRIPWIPAAAVAFATALGLLFLVHYKRPVNPSPAIEHEQTRFRAIPYLAPLAPNENAEIVEMNLRVATLIAMGYRIAADPDEVVPAEVLVGEDGRAHAVRVLSDIDFSGPGD